MEDPKKQPFAFTIEAYGRSTDVWPIAKKYSEPENTAVVLMCNGEFGSETYAIATVNTDLELPPNQAFIKDYSENEGMVNALLEAGIIEGSPMMSMPSGFVILECYKFSDKFYTEVIKQQH